MDLTPISDGKRFHVLVDAGRRGRVRGRIRSQASFLAALVAGAIVGGVMSLFWAVLVGLTGMSYELELVPMIGVTFLVGATVRTVGGGTGVSFGVLGAVLALGSSLFIGLSTRGPGPTARDFGNVHRGGVGVDDEKFVAAALRGFRPGPVMDYLGGLAWWEVALLAFNVIGGFRESRVRLARTQMASLAPRGGLPDPAAPPGPGQAFRRNGSDRLACARGHRADPLAASLPESGGLAVCPRCAEPLRAPLPADRHRLERRQLGSGVRKTLVTLILVVPLFMTLIGLSVHKYGVAAVAVSPDGLLVAVAYNQPAQSSGGAIRVYELASGKVVAKTERKAFALRWLPDGKRLAVAYPGTRQKNNVSHFAGEAGLFEVSSGKWAGVPIQYADWLRDVAVHPDGQTLFSAANDRVIRAWRLPGTETGEMSQKADVVSIALDPAGKLLAAASGDGRLTLWDAAEKRSHASVTAHAGIAVATAFSPDGHTIASVGKVDRTLKLWAVPPTEPVRVIELDCDWATSVSFTPDGRSVAVGVGRERGRGEVLIFDVASGERIAGYAVTTSTVNAVAFTPDGKTLLAGSAQARSLASWPPQGRVHRWNLENAEEMSGFAR